MTKILRIKPLSTILLAATCAIILAGSACADQGCAQNCHVIKPYVDGVKDSDLLVFRHAEAEIGCVGCHEHNEEILKEERAIYESGDYDDPLYTREFENDFCLKCHGSYHELAEKTAHMEEKWERNPHESHMDEPDCYICHKVHQPSTFACGECHHADWKSRLPAGWTVQ